MNEQSRERVFPAQADQLGPVQEFVGQALEQYGCQPRIRFQIDVSIEEIFVNIVRYAYPPGQEGEAVIRCGVGGEPLQVTIQFVDWGKPFNPLEKQDADITLSAEERGIGGLGILMVKKSMDAVDYRYENGENILTLTKILPAR